MIEEKIVRYKNGITTAKELSKRKYADHNYYDDLISRFERILKFYEDLKILRKVTEG